MLGLLIVYAVVYVVHPMFSGTFGIASWIEETFYLSNEGLLGEWKVWQLVSYQLLHAGFFHLLFNGLVLYFFGGDVEKRWNPLRFVGFALVCGLGSAALTILWRLVFPGTLGPEGWSTVQLVGASGAISGVVAAYALFHWNKPLRLWFAISIKGKWLLPLFVLFDVLMSLLGDNVSLTGHLGGMATGFALVVLFDRPNQWWNRFKLWRLRRKLRVMRGDGPSLKDAPRRGPNTDPPGGYYH